MRTMVVQDWTTLSLVVSSFAFAPSFNLFCGTAACKEECGACVGAGATIGKGGSGPTSIQLEAFGRGSTGFPEIRDLTTPFFSQGSVQFVIQLPGQREQEDLIDHDGKEF